MWHQEIISALLESGLDELAARTPEAVNWADVRKWNPDLFDRGLSSTLHSLDIPERGVRDPGVAERLMKTDIIKLIENFQVMTRSAISETGGPLHLRYWRLGADEVDRVRDAILRRFE